MLKMLVSLLLLLPTTAMVFAQSNPCENVVADTVAELKAGGSQWWSDDVESLVRTSAGSACIKALSGRYGSSQPAESIEDNVSGQAGGDVSSAPVAPVEDEPLEFKPLSGSPTKKPFERRRSSDDS